MRKVSCFALLVICGSSLPLQAQPASTKSHAAYCSQTEAFANSHPASAQLFAAVPVNTDPARDHWHPIAPSALESVAKNGNNTAAVTLRQKHIVYVDATFQNQFGDSKLHAQYCFRSDGSLARLHSELTSYHGGMKVIRTMSYDEEGEPMANRAQSFDLQTGKPRRVPADFWDFPPPVFLSVDDLPFAKEIQP